jgi:predicted CopG family antitoxin
VKKMKGISLRNVPDDVYEVLQTMAKANRRSLQEQIKYIIEQEVNLVKGSTVSRASQWRKRFKGRHFTDTLQSIRKDRER